MGCAETSEDLVQSVFLRILKYKSRFSGERKEPTPEKIVNLKIMGR